MRSPIIYILSLILVFCSCAKTNRSYDNISNGHIYVIGHGGSGFSYLINNYPPNSWSSITRAIEYYNAEGSEMDIQMTKDNVLFLYHDQNLEVSSSCIGCVCAYDSVTLTNCMFKSAQGQIPGEHLAPLQRLVDHYKDRTIKPILFWDLHSTSDCVDTRFEEGTYYYNEIIAVNKLLDAYNAYSWINIQSSVQPLIVYVHKNYPAIRMLYDEVKDSTDIIFAKVNGCIGVASESGSMSADLIKYAHINGLKVQLYGASGRSDIVAALNKSPDFYLADDIQLVQSILSY